MQHGRRRERRLGPRRVTWLPGAAVTTRGVGGQDGEAAPWPGGGGASVRTAGLRLACHRAEGLLGLVRGTCALGMASLPATRVAVTATRVAVTATRVAVTASSAR